MPANARSLLITDLYRDRLRKTQERLAREVTATWQAVSVDDLDGTYNFRRVAALIENAQRQGGQTSIGYLAAYLSSELGKRVSGPTLTIETGTTRAGRNLNEAARGPLLGVKVAINDGRDPSESLARGLTEILRTASVSADYVARETLRVGMESDDRIVGWRRTVNGTCGACLGAATGELADAGALIETHPGCLCQPAPQVRGVPEVVKVPTGTEIFAALTVAEQDKEFGPEKAALVRSGAVGIAALVDHSPISNGDDILTERPLDQLN